MTIEHLTCHEKQSMTSLRIAEWIAFLFFYTWSSTFSRLALWLSQKAGLKGIKTGLFFSAAALTAQCAQRL